MVNDNRVHFNYTRPPLAHGGATSYMLKSGVPTGVRCEGGHIQVANAPCGAVPLNARAASMRCTCAVTAICLHRERVRCGSNCTKWAGDGPVAAAAGVGVAGEQLRQPELAAGWKGGG